MVSNSISAISSSMSASNSLLIKLVCSKPAGDFSLYRTSFCCHFTFPALSADQAMILGKQRKREKEITPRATDFMKDSNLNIGLALSTSLLLLCSAIPGEKRNRSRPSGKMDSYRTEKGPPGPVLVWRYSFKGLGEPWMLVRST